MSYVWDSKILVRNSWTHWRLTHSFRRLVNTAKLCPLPPIHFPLWGKTFRCSAGDKYLTSLNWLVIFIVVGRSALPFVHVLRHGARRQLFLEMKSGSRILVRHGKSLEKVLDPLRWNKFLLWLTVPELTRTSSLRFNTYAKTAARFHWTMHSYNARNDVVVGSTLGDSRGTDFERSSFLLSQHNPNPRWTKSCPAEIENQGAEHRGYWLCEHRSNGGSKGGALRCTGTTLWSRRLVHRSVIGPDPDNRCTNLM